MPLAMRLSTSPRAEVARRIIWPRRAQQHSVLPRCFRYRRVSPTIRIRPKFRLADDPLGNCKLNSSAFWHQSIVARVATSATAVRDRGVPVQSPERRFSGSPGRIGKAKLTDERPLPDSCVCNRMASMEGIFQRRNTYDYCRFNLPIQILPLRSACANTARSRATARPTAPESLNPVIDRWAA